MILEIIPYTREYQRNSFDCGKESLNNYIIHNVTKDVKARACTCLVILNDKKEVVGYYTLSSDSIPKDEIPKSLKGSINYEDVPVTLLGRLAVDLRYKGKRIGEKLLLDALLKCMYSAETIGARAVIVDPLDQESEAFYSRYNFTKIPDSGKMFILIQEIRDSFAAAMS